MPKHTKKLDNLRKYRYEVTVHLEDLVGRADAILDQLDTWVLLYSDSPVELSDAETKPASLATYDGWKKCVRYVLDADNELTQADRSLLGMLHIRSRREPPADEIARLIDKPLSKHTITWFKVTIDRYEKYAEVRSQKLFSPRNEGRVSEGTWEKFWCGYDGNPGVIGRRLYSLVNEKSSSVQSLGGSIRASSLTPKRRSEIAKKAAETRWAAKKAE